MTLLASVYVFTFDDADGGRDHDHIGKCIHFFASLPIFFDDPSKLVYCKGGCSYEAGFLNQGMGGRQKLKKYPIFHVFGHKNA